MFHLDIEDINFTYEVDVESDQAEKILEQRGMTLDTLNIHDVNEMNGFFTELITKKFMFKIHVLHQNSGFKLFAVDVKPVDYDEVHRFIS